MTRLGAALILSLIATAALAQSAEYGRAGGDEVALPFKQQGSLSGSLGFTTSSGNFGGKELIGSAGGALVADRLWFFATAQRNDMRNYVTALPQAAVTPAVPVNLADAKLIAQLGARGNFSASANVGTQTTIGATPLTIPSSFLSMHYTGVISPSAFFSASVTSQRTTATTEPAFFTHW